MPLKTIDEIENWIRRRGGLARGLPRLRQRVRAGYLSPAEIDLVKEYLASLDTSKLSREEHDAREARAQALAQSLDGPKAKPAGSTALIASVAVMAALAAAFLIRS